MARTLLPPGFRFHPTDVELVMYYLKRKVLGKNLHFEAIAELNLYKFSPWDLPDKSSLKTKDREWYFFCPTERKYATGVRMNRATESGYWKTTGRDRPIQYKGNVVGRVRTLVFHVGYSPHGKRTDWVIHEYKMEAKSLAANEVANEAALGTYVLCKVFHKNGLGPKNGAQYGALFEEEDWDDCEIPLYPSLPNGPSLPATELQQNQSSYAVVDLSQSGPFSVQASKDALLNGERLSLETSTVNPAANTFGLSSREAGLSFSTHSAQDMIPDNEDVDIAHLLASLHGDPLPLTWNTDIEAHLNSGRETQLVPNSNQNDPFSGLEDLSGLANFNPSGLDFSDAAFVELDDLNAPLSCGSRVGEMPSNEFYSPCNLTGYEHVLPETTQSTFPINGPHQTDLHQLPFGFDSSEMQENSIVLPMGHIYKPAYPRYYSNLTSYEPVENMNCRESGKR